MPKVFQPFTLSEATVALYLLDENDAPITTAPVWAGAQAENLSMVKRAETVSSKPSGVRYPRERAVGESHQVSIESLWLTQFDAATPTLPADFEFDRNARFAMTITWKSDNSSISGDRWAMRVYYGVTCDQFEVASRELFESSDKKTFKAEFYTSKNGVGTPPAA
jgi:hypothetical protein